MGKADVRGDFLLGHLILSRQQGNELPGGDDIGRLRLLVGSQDSHGVINDAE